MVPHSREGLTGELGVQVWPPGEGSESSERSEPALPLAEPRQPWLTELPLHLPLPYPGQMVVVNRTERPRMSFNLVQADMHEGSGGWQLKVAKLRQECGVPGARCPLPDSAICCV